MKRRFVFDTNALVSAALLKASVTRKAFDMAGNTGVILASPATVKELSDVLARPKFERYVTGAERLEFLAAFVREAEIVDASESTHASRDPDDDKFLDLAVAGQAECIVSGDEDLLVLSPFQGIPVVKPAEFLARMLAEPTTARTE